MKKERTESLDIWQVKRKDITKIPGYQNGAFYVQDPAASLAAYLLDPQKGDEIIIISTSTCRDLSGALDKLRQWILFSLKRDSFKVIWAL